MAELKIWFLDVGHGDCAYVELPNGARMMIDCGCGSDHWPSRMLQHYKVTGKDSAIPTTNGGKYGLDNLIITHPHGDHIADIKALHNEIGFRWLTGSYLGMIDDIPLDQIDFRKRGQDAANFFIKVVKRYTAQYEKNDDRVAFADPPCRVNKARFLEYEKGRDLNDLSWLVSFEIAGHKILFTGDMSSAGVEKILASKRAAEFKSFVKGTTILKIPHHGRDNGCSQEMFDAFGDPPLLCIASDEVLNEKNEGTQAIDWYDARTSSTKLMIDGRLQDRKVLTTRKDKDIYLQITHEGKISVATNCFRDKKAGILEKFATQERILKVLLGR